MLHELRTPLNALQGFAELIQQKLFVPVPPRSRDLAASIGEEAARLRTCLNELDHPFTKGSGDDPLLALPTPGQSR